MAKEIRIVQYDDTYKDKWDKFVLQDSVNGTFLQSRNFLSYHATEKFQDNSLLLLNGTTIIAVIPAHLVCDKGRKAFISHQGSTFGGLVVGKNVCKISYLDAMFEKLDMYFEENEYDEIVLKQTGRIYQKEDADLIDYYLFLSGYTSSMELGYFIDFSKYDDEIIMNLSSSKRRDFRYSLKNSFVFRELKKEEEIRDFYEVLCDNYTKFNKTPIHTIEELLDFKYNRLSGNASFYGVYLDEEMVAGGMLFNFDDTVCHTQYLAVKQDKTHLFANEFLYVSLIENAKRNGFSIFSFGTSTLAGGKELNRPLAQFKEGFGTKEYVNYTYKKIIRK